MPATGDMVRRRLGTMNCMIEIIGHLPQRHVLVGYGAPLSTPPLADRGIAGNSSTTRPHGAPDLRWRYRGGRRILARVTGRALLPSSHDGMFCVVYSIDTPVATGAPMREGILPCLPSESLPL